MPTPYFNDLHKQASLRGLSCALVLSLAVTTVGCHGGGGSKGSEESEETSYPGGGFSGGGAFPTSRSGGSVVVAGHNTVVEVPTDSKANPDSNIELTPADDVDPDILGLIGVPVGGTPLALSPAMRVRVAPSTEQGFEIILPYSQPSLGLDGRGEEHVVVVGILGQRFMMVPGTILGSKITASITETGADEGVYQAFRAKISVARRVGEIPSTPRSPEPEPQTLRVPSGEALVDALLSGLDVATPPAVQPPSVTPPAVTTTAVTPPAVTTTTMPPAMTQETLVSETAPRETDEDPRPEPQHQEPPQASAAAQMPETLPSELPAGAPVAMVDHLLQRFEPGQPSEQAPPARAPEPEAPQPTQAEPTEASAPQPSENVESPAATSGPTILGRTTQDPEFRLVAAKAASEQSYETTKWLGESFKQVVIPRAFTARRLVGSAPSVIQVALRFSTTDCFYINSSRSPRRFVLASCTAEESAAEQISTQSIELAVIPGPEIPEIEVIVTWLDFLSFEQLLSVEAEKSSSSDFAALKTRLDANDQRMTELREDHALLLLGLSERAAEVDRTEREAIAALAVQADELLRAYTSRRSELVIQLGEAASSSDKKSINDAIVRLDRTQKADEQRVARAALLAAKNAAWARKKLQDSQARAVRKFDREIAALERSNRALAERISKREDEIKLLEARIDNEQIRATADAKAKEDDREAALAKLAEEHRTNLERIETAMVTAQNRLAELDEALQGGGKISARTLASARSDVSRWTKARESAVATHDRRVASTNKRFHNDLIRIENVLRERLKSLTQRIEKLRQG
jgi:hypothetical protein